MRIEVHRASCEQTSRPHLLHVAYHYRKRTAAALHDCWVIPESWAVSLPPRGFHDSANSCFNARADPCLVFLVVPRMRLKRARNALHNDGLVLNIPGRQHP